MCQVSLTSLWSRVVVRHESKTVTRICCAFFFLNFWYVYMRHTRIHRRVLATCGDDGLNLGRGRRTLATREESTPVASVSFQTTEVCSAILKLLCHNNAYKSAWHVDRCTPDNNKP